MDEIAEKLAGLVKQYGAGDTCLHRGTLPRRPVPGLRSRFLHLLGNPGGKHRLCRQTNLSL